MIAASGRPSASVGITVPQDISGGGEPQRGEALEQVERGDKALVEARIDSARQRQHGKEHAEQKHQRKRPDEIWHREKQAVDPIDQRRGGPIAHQRCENRDRPAEQRSESQ